MIKLRMEPADWESLDQFKRQLWAMNVQRSRETGAAPHKPLLMLIVLSLIERKLVASNALRFEVIEEPFRSAWKKFGGRDTAADPSLPFVHLGSEPFWKLEGLPNGPTPTVTVLRQPSVNGTFATPGLFEALQRNRLARVEAADVVLERWWPTAAARVLAADLALERKHRLLVADPENYRICIDTQTWGAQNESALRDWEEGDVLLFHVTKGAGVQATATVVGRPYRDDAPLWRDMGGKAYPFRVKFRVEAELKNGVSTRDILTRLRPNAPKNWFHGFIQSSHSLSSADAHALLDEFEAESFRNSAVADSTGVSVAFTVKKAAARAVVIGDELTVLRGSTAVAEAHASLGSYKKLRDELIENGRLTRNGDLLTFVEDTVFTSPSAAAAIISGSSTNGRAVWKTADGKPFKWEP